MRYVFLWIVLISATLMAKEKTMNHEVATFGGGCFWCLEAVFEETRGVIDVTSGYAGGHVENPSYEAVCTGTTGHAEVVQITFDTNVVSYEELLKIFWLIHDPTTLNRQGNDVGTQYRSVIFYHDEAQRKKAKASIEHFQTKFLKPIVTELSPLPIVYKAESYHQDYFKNNPSQGYCVFVVSPKVQHFKQSFKEMAK